jgi:hypothetical protein
MGIGTRLSSSELTCFARLGSASGTPPPESYFMRDLHRFHHWREIAGKLVNSDQFLNEPNLIYEVSSPTSGAPDQQSAI